MDANLINPFLIAAKNVIETMAQTPVKPQKPRLKQAKTTYGEVTGIIGMISDQVAGNMILSFSKACILKIVANMLMEPEKDQVDDSIIDAVGELTNMICGGAKAELAKKGMKFNLATPTMVVGKGLEISYYSEAPTIVIPFETPGGEFVIEANLGTRANRG
ncbi:MAG: chemotaxis protein CheX [Thermodesulfobacteriota bacterium]